MRLHRAVIAFALSLLAYAAILALAPSRIVIDGSFDDWASTPVAVRDPVDRNADVDFRALRVAADARFVSLLVEFTRPINTHGLDGSAMMLFDADGNPRTGRVEQGMPGVDLIVDLSPPDPSALKTTEADSSALKTSDRGVGLRVFAQDGSDGSTPARKFSSYDVGLLFAPSYSSARIEFHLERGHVLVGDGALLTGHRFGVKLVSKDPRGLIVDETPPFTAPLLPLAGTPSASVDAVDSDGGGAADPLARAPGTSVRILAWNVSGVALIDHPEPFLRALTAIRPDVLLLDEVAEKSSAALMQGFLAKIGRESDTAWNVVFGEAGGYQRAVVASQHPVSPVEPLRRLLYSQQDRDGLMRMVAQERQGDLRKSLDDAIGTVGASVSIDGRRILVMPVDLQCCGNRATGPEDHRRVMEARTIRLAVKKVLAQQRFDAFVIGGDFNLVGTRGPLDVLRDGLDVDGSSLRISEAWQLDGLSNYTWSGGGGRFAPGRLDYILFSDSTLQLLRAFVYNSRQLAPRWLGQYGLGADDSANASDHLPVVVDFRWKR